ncbi:MAG TPA: FAD-dependent monooxygenase [Thermohalobaculum sp.]|nr:FAD-dependent monooxygenase [Thermohalobaculum sp.]
MERIETDILVAGGGIAGLAATARLAAAGWRVTCVDPAPGEGQSASPPADPPADQPTDPPADLRTTAFLLPAVETLERAGAWAAMAPHAAPLRTMRLVDAGGRARAAREVADFAAREIMDRPFGWNVPNAAIRAALMARLAGLAAARLIPGARVERLLPRTAQAVAWLSDGRQLRARLVVAADGRDSQLRAQAGIPARRWHYGQKALVLCVTHDRPHGGVSTEIHRSGGPLTLVPMPDRAGRPSSSVVWMTPGPRAARLAGLDDAALAAELTAETLGLFGPLAIAGPRAVWPIIGQLALRLTGERLALIAEAAHVVPPIGAQGLNMSLADVETLAGLVAQAPDPGAPALLAAYQRRRWPETAARAAGIDLLNRAARAEAQPLRDLRRLGLRAIHDLAPLRRLAMRLGLGAG